MADVFNKKDLEKLHRPDKDSSGEDNGLVTIIGGSELFHGAPLLSLKVASRIVDMVFFASPEPSVGGVAERIKSQLFSFIWVPWEEVDEYVAKSDASLIGPGFMRFKSEKQKAISKKNLDVAGKYTREITERLLKRFPDKRWVIDAGSLQVMQVDWIPESAILTPNESEYKYLFDDLEPNKVAKKYNCVINSKGEKNIVFSLEKCVEIPGGNRGLARGGTGDVLAGLTVALLAKNEPFLAAAAASYITKAAADELYKQVGINYNADDLAEKIPETLHKMT